MKVLVQLESQPRIQAGVECVDLELPAKSSIEIAIEEIQNQFHLELSDSVLVFVNDQPLPASRFSSTQLREGDRVLLFPPISGG